MYILVSYCAPISRLCLFGVHSFRTKSVEFSGESQAFALLNAKWKYFHGFLTLTDGEYTCEMLVMHLGKEHIAQNSSSLSAAHAAFLSEPL